MACLRFFFNRYQHFENSHFLGLNTNEHFLPSEDVHAL